MLLTANRFLAGIDPLAGAWIVVAVIAVCAALVLYFVLAVASILNSKRISGGVKTLWLMASCVFPVLGPTAWFLVGRGSGSGQLRTPRL
ncbi:hypothetical protein GCM10022198_16080 [Klugiella xanthotipulae]|uniref:Phospholipase D-like protein n=1 Tax=Klugiella xanthotipulae TaxID=244735 RepID=A0A543HH36_9MICO|nr:PLDc N-terminal domain-containing protein [Klugiella xanthotipulae]TQM57646.1 phospholipase D-like protein [Klugiella xanthotipulae]